MSAGRALGLAVLAALFASPHLSSAQPQDAPHPFVSLDVDPCVGVDRAEIRRIVGVELGVLLVVEGEGAPSADTTRVTATCKDALLELRVDDPITGKILTRLVDLSREAASAQSRLLAIAMAELVSASWTELAENPQPELPPAGPPPSAASRDAAMQVVRSRAPRRASAAAPRRLSLALAFEAREFLPRTGPTLGAGLRAVGLLPGALGWSLDAVAAHGARSIALGDVSTDTVSLGASAFVHHTWAGGLRWSLRGGPGLRLGVARLTGETTSGAVQAGSVSGPWGGPMASGALGFDPWSGITLEIGAEAGYDLFAVRGLAAGAREAAIAGPSLAAGVALGVFR